MRQLGKVSTMVKATDILIKTIQDWGVELIFGRPGDGIIESLRQRKDKIPFIRV